jgi:hypothetical protein
MTKPTIARNDEVQGAVYYASGSNHAGEIAGMADLELPLGVTVDEVNAEALAQLEADEPRIRHLFVDSGAFGEVDRKDVRKIVRPISDADWRERLATYQRLGEVFGSKMVAVAPDRVACQKTTLARLSKYRKAVQALAATGCGILVPVQRGEHSLTDFFKRCTWALGMTADKVIPAFPMKKGATKPAAIIEFAKATRPARVHMLGLGRTNPKAPKLVAQLEALGVAVTLDSCLITAAVGKTNGRDNHPAEHKRCPRILTACTKYQPAGLSTFERKRRSIQGAFSTDALWTAQPGTPRRREGWRVTFIDARDLPPVVVTDEQRERSRKWLAQCAEWQRKQIAS